MAMRGSRRQVSKGWIEKCVVRRSVVVVVCEIPFREFIICSCGVGEMIKSLMTNDDVRPPSERRHVTHS